jgi:proteic killer suppression protein
MINQVILSKTAQRDLMRAPGHVAKKMRMWVDQIKSIGLLKTRQIPGYHDEPLKGDRTGQRSVRLNIAYRAIYQLREDGEIEIVEILEVNKHKY